MCSGRCRSPQPSATISLAAVATCVRQPLSEILQPAAAGRWRRARPRRLRARMLSCATLQRRLVVVLVVSFPWWCGGTSSLPGSSSFSSSNVVVIVLNVSKTQIYRWRAKRRSCLCTRLLLYGYGINTVEESNVDTFFPAAID